MYWLLESIQFDKSLPILKDVHLRPIIGLNCCQSVDRGFLRFAISRGRAQDFNTCRFDSLVLILPFLFRGFVLLLAIATNMTFLAAGVTDVIRIVLSWSS